MKLREEQLWKPETLESSPYYRRPSHIREDWLTDSLQNCAIWCRHQDVFPIATSISALLRDWQVAPAPLSYRDVMMLDAILVTLRILP